MLRFLRETAEIEVTGASMVLCLNRWTAADLPFWDLSPVSDLVFRCRVYGSQLDRVRREAERAWCSFRVLRRFGLPQRLRRLRSRPVLPVGLVLALCLALFLQNFVWFVRVEGNDRVSTEELLHALYEEGVRFGAWGPSLNSAELKNRMLNRINELQWLAVNVEGGVARVLVAERVQEVPRLEEEGVAHIVAVRPGIVRELRVENGFAAVEPGDAVLPGEILISGIMEWTTHIQATRAMGEVYAETFRPISTVCPDETLKKVYTGRTETCKTLIFERKREKISGNSSIFGTMCDRMIETRTWTLPGGWELPVRIETVTLLEYRLEPAPLSAEEAERLLREESLRLTRGEMVSGTVETGSCVTEKTRNGYFCRCAWNCLELISRTQPAEPFREEAYDGEIDQRGTN